MIVCQVDLSVGAYEDGAVRIEYVPLRSDGSVQAVRPVSAAAQNVIKQMQTYRVREWQTKPIWRQLIESPPDHDNSAHRIAVAFLGNLLLYFCPLNSG